MNNFKTFCEATNQKLIVVDVQPTYRGYISFDIWKFLEYVQSFKQVLYIHNGRDTSNDDRQDVKNWLIEEADYDDDFINHMDSWDWQEKEFGFLRPWMDNGASDDFIVKALRFMEKNRKKIPETLNLKYGLRNSLKTGMMPLKMTPFISLM